MDSLKKTQNIINKINKYSKNSKSSSSDNELETVVDRKEKIKLSLSSFRQNEINENIKETL